MEDPTLNRHIEETRELYTRWGQFHDFFAMALKGEKVTSEAEMKFLDLKTRIAMLHDGFMQSLKHDHKVGQQVLGILGSCILLRRIPLMNNAEVQKLELDWNEAYMLMNETIAGLEEERQRLANINEQAYKLNKMKEMVFQKIHNFFVSSAFIFVFFVIALPAFLIWGVPALDIYQWTQIPIDMPWLAKPYKSVVEVLRWTGMDIPYTKMDEVPFEKIEAKDHRDDPTNTGGITVDYLKSQLVNMGFTTTNVPEARSLIDNRADFGKEKRNMNTRRTSMIGIYVLFKSNIDADKFIQLRKEGMATYKKEVQERIRSTINICRKQNMVAIFTSEEALLRDTYPKEKWGFSDGDMKLAQ